MGADLLGRTSICFMGVIAAGSLMIPSESAAQTSEPAGSLPAFRIPRVMISAGLGSSNSPPFRQFAHRKPMPTVSVQFLPTRHLGVEGEFVWWEETWDQPCIGCAANGVEVGTLEAWSAGINLLYRTAPR